MHLDVLPIIFILIGLAMYTVLSGADFGAGFWQLTADLTPTRKRCEITLTMPSGRCGRPIMSG